MAVSDNQVRTYLGNEKVSDNPKFGVLTEMVDTVIPVEVTEDVKDFTITGGAVNFIELPSASNPDGAVYLDGTTYEGRNGGIAVKQVTNYTAGATGQLVINKRVLNVCKILDSENDEMLKVEFQAGKLTEAKYVLGLLQTKDTSLADGDTPSDKQLALQFVVYDDTNNAFVPYDLEDGTYKYQAVKIYTLGTASAVDALGNILSGTDPIGGYALEELADTITKPQHGYAIIEFTNNHKLQGDIQLVCTSTSIDVYDDGTKINDVTVDIEGDYITALKKNTDNVGKKAIINNIRVDLNGATIRTSKVDYGATADSFDIKMDFSQSIIGDTIYKDSYIQVLW